MAEFLLEIGLEEAPARMLPSAQAELGERLRALLAREQLLEAGAEIRTYSTPRRLAALARGVALQQPDRTEVLTGPSWAVAFREGVPTPAAVAFARKAGVAVEELAVQETAKGAYASASVLRRGRHCAEVLSELLPGEIAALSWPKPMYWRPGKAERFVRPVQWLVALLDGHVGGSVGETVGESVVPLEFAGVRAGRGSRGHRVLHGEAPVQLGRPGDYVDALLAAHVMVDADARRHTIRKALDRATRNVAGARWREDEKLVETVTHLVEWPSVLLGSFSRDYLALPEEVLVTVMRDHQKYFAVEDDAGKLLPHFLTVLNTVTDERGEGVIRHGNERVLRARFNDAQFFWDFDRKIPFAERGGLLEKVTFQKDLGTYRQKTERTRGIAQRLAATLRERGVAIDMGALDTAVELAKVDLTTELVKEFTELQGIVGGLYARAEGLGESVAQAVYWQYRPAAITDAIPPTVEGQILGLADRIGTIVDLLSLGLVPSGSRDPYALRRAANGVIKILAASGLPLSPTKLINLVVAMGTAEAERAKAVVPFLHERLDFYLREVCGFAPDVVRAVLATYEERIPDAQARAEALTQVRGSDDLVAIAAAWKRTKNILRQAEEKAIPFSGTVRADLLHAEAERALWAAVQDVFPRVEAMRGEGQYAAALEAIATLRPYVDRFFEETMVLVDDVELRANRLALLHSTVVQLGAIADFSELVPDAAR